MAERGGGYTAPRGYYVPNRILKESICTSDQIDALSWFEEVVWYRLIVNCDDYGRMDGRIPVLKSRLFPLKSNITDKMLSNALDRLAGVRLIRPYVVSGRPHIQIVTWDKHQQVRAKRSKYPAPDINETAHDIICNQLISNDSICPRNPIQSESESNAESESESADEPLELAMNAFREMRKKIKAPMTDKAERMILTELQKLAPNDEEKQIAILNQSTMKGWRGVFPLKDAPQQPDRFANLKRMYEEAEG